METFEMLVKVAVAIEILSGVLKFIKIKRKKKGLEIAIFVPIGKR